MKSWLSEILGPIRVQEAGAGVEAWVATQAAVGKKLVFNLAGDSVSTWPVGTGRKRDKVGGGSQ